MISDLLLQKHPLVSDQVSRQELKILLSALEAVLRTNVAGDVVEFGCYLGTTSLFLQRMLQQSASPRKLFVYDSFQGLPEKTDADQSPAGMQFMPGELYATKSQFMAHFKKASLPLPVIKKAWFDELTPTDIPQHVAFAFLDGDYYDSIKQSLQLIEPVISDGGVIIVDDYQNEALPGATRAVDEWLIAHPNYRLSSMASLAILKNI